MANSSPELIWQIVRRSNRFLYKGRTNVGFEASSERGNLRNVNSYKFSALTGAPTVGVEVTKSGSGAVLKRVDKQQRNGGALHSKVDVKGNRKKAFATVDGAVAETRRGDLKRHALARYNALHRAQQRGSAKK